MSRTDRHRPYRVQVQDPWEKNKSTNHWSGANEPYLLHNTCGCYYCSKWAFTTPPAQKDRRETRRRLRKGDWD